MYVIIELPQLKNPKHVQDKHPGKPVREKIVEMLSFDNFVSKVSNSANNNVGHNSQHIEQQIDVLEEEEVEETVTLETIYKQMKQNHCDFM